MEVVKSLKRKAPGNATPSADGSASKRLKLLNSNAPPAVKSQVQELGWRLLEQMRKSTDKTGRLITKEFLTLPPRDELPDYYDLIKLPISIETIAQKLQRNVYPTMTTLESDMKRMVQNAKDYNAPKSDIYEDAERIRKLMYNFMKVHNPVYGEDPNYSSFPTPIPETNGTHSEPVVTKDEPMHDPPESRAVDHKPKKIVLKASGPSPERKPSIAPSGTTGNGDADGKEEDGSGDGIDIDFAGKSFQEAQQMIIAHLLHYTDEETVEVYSPFANLPSRRLEDYYKLIRHPVSLKSIAKRTRGIHGRAPPTNATDFKTWDQFENEVSFIWRNAREYNEDGSDMYNLADEFEEYFKVLLADAKDKVEEPAALRIKLGGPKPKVTLNLTQHRGSPAPGVHVDSEALLRQKQMVQAGVNGRQTDTGSNPTSNGVRSSSQGPAIETRTQHTVSAAPPKPAFKTETLASPSLPNSTPLTNGMMPPPAVRPPSGSPFYAQTAINSFNYTAPALLPPVPVRSYPLAAALLPAVTIATHPQLKISNPLNLAIPPHPTLAQQSTTVTLPGTHYFVQIAPSVSPQLAMGRAYKLFVTVNGTRLNQRDSQLHADTGRRTHVYEGSLAQGVNRIEVEIVAAKAGGGGKEGEGEGLEVEKVTVFANLMR